MFIPRITAIGIGVSALATATGLAAATSLPMVKSPGWGEAPSPARLGIGGVTMATMFTTLGFGLFSSASGLKPVGAAIAALAGAAALGSGLGSLMQHITHPPTTTEAPGPRGGSAHTPANRA